MILRFLLFFVLLFTSSPLTAGIIWQDGWLVGFDHRDEDTARSYFSAGQDLLLDGQPKIAARYFKYVIEQFPLSDEYAESFYWLGVCEFSTCELEHANEALSLYLDFSKTPYYFKDALEMKFEIAERFRCGHKKRLFGLKCFPRWAPSDTYALEIYDEIASSIPCDPLAAMALFSKGIFLKKMSEYSDSIMAFQEIIRRFPKDEIAIESYVEIACIYRKQCASEFQNPDLLCLAEINLRRFSQQFPQDPRVESARNMFLEMQELYAFGLFETAHFYERKCCPKAAVIYYQNAIYQFPETQIAELCREHLQCLCIEDSFLKVKDSGVDEPKVETQDDSESK